MIDHGAPKSTSQNALALASRAKFNPWRVAALSGLMILARPSNGQSEIDHRPVKLASGQRWPGSDRPPQAIDATGQRFAAYFRGQVSDVRITPVTISGGYRAIETSKQATVSDVTIDGLTAGVLRECIRVIGDRIVIRNTKCRQIDGPRTARGDLPEGVHVEAGNEILIEQSEFSGFQMTSADDKYWNGDGIAAERPVTGLVIRDVIADNNTDAGFDIKPTVKMDRVSAQGNCRNFRFWSSATIGTMTVGDTVKRGGKNHCNGIWFLGRGKKTPEIPVVTIDKLVVRATGPIDLIGMDGPLKLSIARCDIPKSLRLEDVEVRPHSELSLGKGCEMISRVLVKRQTADRAPDQEKAAEPEPR